MKHILLAAMLLGMGISSANAAEIPITAGKDQRVTTVRYNENEVYEINAKPSIVTHIVSKKVKSMKLMLLVMVMPGILVTIKTTFFKTSTA